MRVSHAPLPLLPSLSMVDRSHTIAMVDSVDDDKVPVGAKRVVVCPELTGSEALLGMRNPAPLTFGWRVRVAQLIALVTGILLFVLGGHFKGTVRAVLFVIGGTMVAVLIVMAVYEYSTSNWRLAARNRAIRLKEGPVRRLYHQTAKENATKIMDSETLFAGSKGLAGGGIYFATSKAHTQHKALTKGIILTCCVRLGRIKRVPHRGDSSLSSARMAAEGYDSVVLLRNNGHEYVVYRPDQVTILSFEYT